MALPAYFLSDLHLGCSHPSALADREARAIELLRSWRGQASHVFLMGDLFEFWMEYIHYINCHHFGFLRAIAELVESGVEVHYLCGNHDFQLDAFFPSLGVHIHETLKIEVQGLRLWLQHGDGMSKSDWGYRLARPILHNKLNLFLFRLLHPDWGMALARFVGSTSRDALANCDSHLDEYADCARSIMKRESCQAMVHGHTHHASITQFPEGVHVDCGQWLFELNYVELREGAFRCVQCS